MAIPIEALRAVSIIVVHTGSKPCPDGRASALILHAALPSAGIMEIAYGSPEHQRLVARPGMLFCDFTPPAERIAEFVAAGAIVLDHHDPALVAPFGERGVWGDNAKGESGAVLAVREVLAPLRGPAPGYVPDGRWKAAEEIARLAAIIDTWQTSHSDWNAAGEIATTLVFPTLDDLLNFTPGEFLSLAASIGPMLLKRAREAAHAAASTAVRFDIRGQRVAVIDDYRSISDAAEQIGDDADVTVAFEYVHDTPTKVRMGVHLRARGKVDVREIAKRYQGGGHKQAAGFSVAVNPNYKGVDPYDAVYNLLGNALDSGAGLGG